MLNALIIKSAVILSAALLLQPAAAGEPVLRLQKDAARERAWVLARGGVQVFDFRTPTIAARIALPEWTWAGEQFSCLPDLALGPKGEAVITSNVVPALWRVDPVTLAVTRHELVLDADTAMDVGFTGIAYSPRVGAFFAVSSYGALWRIDPLLRRAQKIPLSAPIAGACGVSIQPAKGRFVGLCVSGPQGGWTINLAPDQRSGYVFAQPCASEGKAAGL